MKPEFLNPVTGDTMRILRSSADVVEFAFTIPPGSPGSPLHFHRTITETFAVQVGTLAMVHGDPSSPVQVTAGQAITVSPPTVHRFWNPGSESVSFTCKVSPGESFESFMRAHYQLAIEGLAAPSGMPKGLLEAVVMIDLADFHVPGIPGGLQAMLRSMLVGLARLTGAEARIHQLGRESL